MAMSFNVLRAPVRRAAVLSRPFPMVRPFRPSFRYNSSTSTPPPKSNLPFIAGLGVVILAAGGYYVYTSDSAEGTKGALKSGAQVRKAYANFTPAQEDYQKVGILMLSGRFLTIPQLQVYNKIAELLDEAGEYDGELHQLRFTPLFIKL